MWLRDSKSGKEEPGILSGGYDYPAGGIVALAEQPREQVSRVNVGCLPFLRFGDGKFQAFLAPRSKALGRKPLSRSDASGSDLRSAHNLGSESRCVEESGSRSPPFPGYPQQQMFCSYIAMP